MSAGGRVLIVDDEESMRLLLGRIVESLPGVEVRLAASSDEGLRLAGAERFDLILLDLLMPGKGGIEVLGSMRRESPNRTTPVIVVSVMADPDTLIACRSLGISEYIVKPVVRDALLAAVRAHLSPTPKA